MGQVKLKALSLTAVLAATVVRSAGAQTNDEQWNLNLAVRQSQILGQERDNERQSDQTVDSANASLNFRRVLERSSVGVSGRVGANRFTGADSDQINYGASFSWDYDTSTRSRMSLSQTVSRNFPLETLANLGVAPINLDTLEATTSWTYGYQSSARTSWSTSAGYGFRRFDNDQPVDASQIVLDQDPLVDEFPLPELGTDPIDLELGDGQDDLLQIIASEGIRAGTNTTHFAVFGLGVNHLLSERTTFGLSLNGSYRTFAGFLDTSGPRGGAQVSLQRQLTRSSFTSVGYTFQRSFIQDPGVTVHTASVGWGYSPPSARVSLEASIGASAFQQGDDPTSTSPVGSVAFTASLTESTTLGTIYSRQYTVPLGFGDARLLDYANASLSQAFGERVTASLFAGVSYGEDPIAEGANFSARRLGGNLNVRLLWGLSVGTTYFYAESDGLLLGTTLDQAQTNWSYFLSYTAGW